MSHRYSIKPNPHHPLTILREHLFSLRKQYRQRPTAELYQFMGMMAKQHHAKTGETLTYGTELPRHKIIEWLLERGEIKFKEEWLKRYEWPFDDCRDARAWPARINQEHEKQQFILAWTELKRIEEAPRPENADAAYDADKAESIAEIKEALEISRYTWDAEKEKPVWRQGVILEMFLPIQEMAVKLGEPAPFNCLVISNEQGATLTIEQFRNLQPEKQKEVRDFMSRRIREIVEAGFGGVLPGTQGKVVDIRLHPNAIPCKTVPDTPTLRDLVAKQEPQPVAP